MMHIEMVDNVRSRLAPHLQAAIQSANDVRLAVAFISQDGLTQIDLALSTALDADAQIEMLIGMDSNATDPRAVQQLYQLAQRRANYRLFCFIPQQPGAIYHPKIYLMKSGSQATAIIGSSNLTRRGLQTNIEANLLIQAEADAEIISEIYATYHRLKTHPDRVVPDQEFVDLFSELHAQQSQSKPSQEQSRRLKKLRTDLLEKAQSLPRPKMTQKDLFGWLEKVYDILPEGEFSNRQVYAHASGLQAAYPGNQNVHAKIRQQLQFLAQMGLLEHLRPGFWRKIA